MKISNNWPKVYSFFMLVCCLLFCSGCVKDPELIGIENMEFLEQEGDYVLTNITGIVKNPNRVGAKVKKVEAKIFIEGEEVGFIDSEQDIKMKGRETKSVSMQSKIDLAVFSKLFPSMMSKDSTWVAIDGIYHVSTGVSTIKIKSKTRKKMALREAIHKQVERKLNSGAFDIANIKLNEGGISESTWTMAVNLKNDFGIDYAIDSIKLNLFLPNQETPFGSWRLADPISIAADTSETIKAKVRIDNGKVLSQFLFNIFGSKQVRISGLSYVHLDKYPFTIPISQKVPLMGM